MAQIKWVDLDVAMFPKEVQAVVAAIHKADAEHYAKVKPLKEQIAKLMAPFEPRIAVEGERVLQPGHKMQYSFRSQWSAEPRFACGSVERKTTKKAKSAVVLT